MKKFLISFLGWYTLSFIFSIFSCFLWPGWGFGWGYFWLGRVNSSNNCTLLQYHFDPVYTLSHEGLWALVATVIIMIISYFRNRK